VTPDIATAYGLSVHHGVLIRSFVPDATGKSPVRQAGLRAGDVPELIYYLAAAAALASGQVTWTAGENVPADLARAGRGRARSSSRQREAYLYSGPATPDQLSMITLGS
jgi:hypothetical protein